MFHEYEIRLKNMKSRQYTNSLLNWKLFLSVQIGSYFFKCFQLDDNNAFGNLKISMLTKSLSNATF